MQLVLKILAALVSALPTFLDWWNKRQAAQKQAEIEIRNADIDADPGSAWLRKFNSRAEPDDKAVDDKQAGVDQSDGDK